MKEEEKVLDATGNLVEIGGWYGRAHVDNGFTEIRIGQVSDTKEGKVRLDVKYSQKVLYVGKSWQDPLTIRKVWYKGNSLFPVDETKVKWSKNG